MMIREELLSEKKRRFDFVEAVYTETGANHLRSIDMWEVGRKLGFDRQVTERVFQYLSHEGLIRSMAIGGAIGITHAGIVEVEAALAAPDTPTTHFPAFNYIHVEHMTNSQIQQGTQYSTQNQSVSNHEIQELKEYLQTVRDALPQLPFSDTDKQEAEAELLTLEAQSKSTKPKLAIIKASWNTLKELLMHTGGAIIAHELIAHAPKFL